MWYIWNKEAQIRGSDNSSSYGVGVKWSLCLGICKTRVSRHTNTKLRQSMSR